MRSTLPVLVVALLVVARLCNATGIVTDSVTVGQNLQAVASISLKAPVPSEGLTVRVTSTEPSRLLLATSPECAGTPAIDIPLRAGFQGPVEFYVHGLASKGAATYTVSAPGFESAAGTVTLAPSGIIFVRPMSGISTLRTTTGAGKSQINLYSAVLDAALNYLAPQPVAGGLSISAEVTSSNPKAGKVTPASVIIPGGSYNAATNFEPTGLGDTTLAINLPSGFSRAARFGSIPATVVTPGIAVANELTIGRNLEVEWIVNLGEAAPPGGITVTLTSGDPARLLLATSANTPGLPSIQLPIPPGGVSAAYYLQALGDAGTVVHTASAPGFLSRVGTIVLAPSGVVIGGPQGPPDEAELFRKEVAEGPHGFAVNLSARRATPITVYMVQLDPVTHRGADLTVQRLRAGLSLAITLKNTNSAIGKLADSQLILKGSDSSVSTQFTALAPGATEISVITPEGYTPAANARSMTVKVLP